MICSLSIVLVLMLWNMVDSGGDAKVLMVSIPMLLSLILASVKIMALIRENDKISDVIEQLQQHVRQRTTFFFVSKFYFGNNSVIFSKKQLF